MKPVPWYQNISSAFSWAQPLKQTLERCAFDVDFNDKIQVFLIITNIGRVLRIISFIFEIWLAITTDVNFFTSPPLPLPPQKKKKFSVAFNRSKSVGCRQLYLFCFLLGILICYFQGISVRLVRILFQVYQLFMFEVVVIKWRRSKKSCTSTYLSANNQYKIILWIYIIFTTKYIFCVLQDTRHFCSLTMYSSVVINPLIWISYFVSFVFYKLLCKWTKWMGIHLCTLHELQPVIHWVPVTMRNLFNKNVFFISSTRCSRNF